MGPPLASIVITTRNRKDELRNALTSALSQTAPAEVLVIDDASTDATLEMVRQEFPTVRAFASDRPEGLIVQRNRAARLAEAPVIVSIDDDAVFTSPRVVEQTLAAFDHPRVGAIAMPYVDVAFSNEVRCRAPRPDGIYVTAMFRGTAHALRRDLFLKLGGYRGELFQFGEERDLCIRMLEAGYVTRLGTSDVIHHFLSPRRQQSRAFIEQGRNSLLFAWHNAPMPWLPLHLAATTMNVMKMGISGRHPLWASWGVIRGWGGGVRDFKRRRPVSRRTYELSRRLGRGDGTLLDELEPDLRPMRFPEAPIAPLPA